MKRILMFIVLSICLANMAISSNTQREANESVGTEVISQEKVHKAGNIHSMIGLEEYLVEEIEKKTVRIDLSQYAISKEKLVDTLMPIMNRHPELFYISHNIRGYGSPSGDIVTSVELTYLDYSQEEIDWIYSQMNKPLDMLSDEMNTVEKLLFLHDYLVVNTEYAKENVQDERCHSIVGVALDGKAVCDGYAKAFQYYMNALQIPCNIIGNDTHAWNQVQIDGEWYMVDVTHDDPSEDLFGRVSHTYFLKSETGMGNRKWNTAGYPACDSTKYDDAFWNQTNSQMIYYQGEWYFVGAEDDFIVKIYRHNFKENALTKLGKVVLRFSGRWYVYGETDVFWEGNYSRIGKYNDTLIYSTPTEIYQCAWDEKDKECIVKTDATQGYIYGMKIVEDTLLYQLSKAPSGEEVTQVDFDLKSISVKVKDVVRDSKSGASYVVTKTGKKGGTVAYKKNHKKMFTEVVIPDKIQINGKPYKVSRIADKAFKNNRRLVKIVIPSSVKSIGKEAFRGCTGLKEITLPPSVKSIGKKAFYGCHRLKRVTIQSKKLKEKSIGTEVFAGISKKAIVRVPMRKEKLYKSILRKKGLYKKITIKGIFKKVLYTIQ